MTITPKQALISIFTLLMFIVSTLAQVLIQEYFVKNYDMTKTIEIMTYIISRIPLIIAWLLIAYLVYGLIKSYIDRKIIQRFKDVELVARYSALQLKLDNRSIDATQMEIVFTKEEVAQLKRILDSIELRRNNMN